MKSKKKFIKWFKNLMGKRVEAFTFVETLSVLAIAAVLTAGSAVSMSKLMDFAKKTSAKNQVMQYKSALYSYFLDCGSYPTTEQGLEALWKKPDLYPVPENWDGPYVENEISKDPWGSVFIYESAEDGISSYDILEKLPFVILSYGADRKKGGEGKNEDILSWK